MLAVGTVLDFKCCFSAKDTDKISPNYELQEDPVQQRILESAKTFKNQHDTNQTETIRQAIKLRKDLFMDVWPNHNIET